ANVPNTRPFEPGIVVDQHAFRPCANAAVRHPYTSQRVSDATSDTITCVLRRAAAVQGPPSRSTGVPGNRLLRGDGSPGPTPCGVSEPLGSNKRALQRHPLAVWST